VSAVGFLNAARRNLSASRRYSQYETTVIANLRIPMKLNADSDRRRSVKPIQAEHQFRRS
jgi:hypothetical protein